MCVITFVIKFTDYYSWSVTHASKSPKQHTTITDNLLPTKTTVHDLE